jgi:hypothetical protein
MNNEKLFEQILNEFVAPSADGATDEQFKMSEFVDDKRHLAQDFISERKIYQPLKIIT